MVPRIAPREELNPFRIAQIQFDIAAEVLKLDQIGVEEDFSNWEDTRCWPRKW